MSIINPFTFVATGSEPLSWAPGESRETGTVECTLGRDTRRVAAVRYENGRIVTWAIGGRYRTGTKIWTATVSIEPGGREFWHFGNDDRSGRCVKSSLFFLEA